ncbi:MAG: RNA polymerase sigma factor, partial [Bacteroidales bacterium]|nr:RNA polymerase sigma factor [Bacteroidales bacterium]
MSEKELIQQAIRGDQTAYREIYQVYEKSVRGRVSGYFKWKADVDDVTMETFQKAFAALGTFDTSREFRPWLLTIATRTALDHLGQIKREDQTKEGFLQKASEGPDGES